MSQNENKITNYNERDLELFLNELLNKISLKSLSFFNSELEVKNKKRGKFDPVTNADIEIEKIIRNEIEKKFPNLSIYGEEFESELNESSPYISVDPIDGTKSFIAGVPTWTTLIGFNTGTHPLIGFADQPLLNERYIGLSRESFLLKNESKVKITVSKKTKLKDSILSCTDPIAMFEKNSGLFKSLESTVSFSRYGLDAYAYCLLASGLIDIVIDTDLKIYDIQPLIPIIRSAGGYIATWDNGDPSFGGNIIATSSKELFLKTQEILLAKE